MKIYIEPNFRGTDKGDGGIRRIVEAQIKHLPKYGFEIVGEMDQADIVATHAGILGDIPVEKPWVVHTHGLYWSEYVWSRWHHDLNNHVITAMRRADIVTAPSEWVAQSFRRGMWLNPAVLTHGIDLEDWAKEVSGGYVLWNKTRPDPVCDPQPVIDLAKQTPDLTYVTTFGERASNVTVTGRMGFEGAKEMIKRAGVYLCTTRETFGVGTLEAMASEVPVVGYYWGGQREIIKHGETGWLVTPGDIDGLEEGVRWALANRAEIGAAARADVAQRFTWDIAMTRYAQLYEDVLNSFQDRHEGPIVSVVIPCYNLARFLPDTIKSLVDQSFQHWEAIIVNDASPDNTAEVAGALASQDARIKVVTNETNQYLAGALNTGISVSTGRFIIPLDADNMLAPDALELLVHALDKDRELDIVYGAVQFVQENGRHPDTTISPNGVSGWPTAFSFRGQMLQQNQIPSTAMFRRKVWERSGGYRKRFVTAEDADFWTRAVSLGFVPQKVTNKITLIYRQRAESMSRNNTKPNLTAWYPWSRHMDMVPFGVHEKPPAHINGGIAWPVASYEPVKLSVIIPVGPGHEELLIDALDSVEAQTFRDFECLVVNDTGHELVIPHTWAKVITGDLTTPYHLFQPPDPEINCCVCGHDEHWHERMGPGRARNLAIAKSIARVFVPLDADDFLQSEALANLYHVWTQFKGVVYSQWWDQVGSDLSLYDPPEFDATILTAQGAIHAVTALYEKSAWQLVGGFDETLSHWEDWDFHLALASQGICGTKIPLPLFTYRKHTGFRREENMAAFDNGKEEILKKWSHLWDRKETLRMACAGCPKGRVQGPPVIPSSSTAMLSMKARQGYGVIKYVGGHVATQQYQGPSGTKYRFGNNPGHDIKYVLDQDIDHLLSLRDGGRAKFVIHVPPAVNSETVQETVPVESAPALVAVGAPQREQEAEAVAAINEPQQPPQEFAFPDQVQDRPDGERIQRLPEHGPQVHDLTQSVGQQAASEKLPTVSELRKAINGMTREELSIAIAREKDGPNRSTAIAILETAFREKTPL